MILPKIGTRNNPDLELANNDLLNIVRHNLWVGQELRSIVPHGPSPLSAMLADLKEYPSKNGAPTFKGERWYSLVHS